MFDTLDDLVRAGVQEGLDPRDLVVLERERVHDRLAPLLGDARALGLVHRAEERAHADAAHRREREEPLCPDARREQHHDDRRHKRERRAEVGLH